MCGRYSLTTPLEAVRRLFGVEAGGGNLEPRWNIAPTQAAPVVRADPAGVRALTMLRWGLVPAWSKNASGAAKMINARADTVAEKPAYRAAFRRRRCLVPADGFYEWKAAGRERQPYRIAFDDGRAFAFAGLWERWEKAPDGPLETFTILTTDANATLLPLHHRMPVILQPDEHAAWLDAERSLERALLAPRPLPGLAWFPVDRRVNDVRNDDAGCVRPLDAAAEPPRQGSLF
jgi:putative SOS response-associated peptidase YedK